MHTPALGRYTGGLPSNTARPVAASSTTSAGMRLPLTTSNGALPARDASRHTCPHHFAIKLPGHSSTT